MGWWSIEDGGGGLMGDGPADELGSAIDQFFERFAERPLGTRRVPALAELSYALNIAFQEVRSEILEQAAPGHGFVSHHDSSSVVPAGNLQPQDWQPFCEAFRRIAREYLDCEVARLPTTQEVVHCVEFCAGTDAEHGRFAEGILKDVAVGFGEIVPAGRVDVVLGSEAGSSVPGVPAPEPLDPVAEEKAWELLDHLEQLSDSPDDALFAAPEDVRFALATRPTQFSVQLALKDPSLRVREQALRQALRFASGTEHEAKVVAAALSSPNPRAREALLDEMLDWESDEAQELILRLASDPEPAVRARWANQAHVQALIRQRGVLEELVERLALDPAPEVRAASPATRPSVLAALACHSRSEVRSWAASNPSTPVRALRRLAAETELQGRVASHSKCPAELLEQLASSEDSDVRAAVGRNESAPESLLLRLAVDREVAVRRAVARNSSTPESGLATLAKDSDERVAREAARRLQWRTAR